MIEDKKPRGRPPLPMPEPIPDTPENIARAILNTPPKDPHEWDHLKKLRTPACTTPPGQKK